MRSTLEKTLAETKSFKLIVSETLLSRRELFVIVRKRDDWKMVSTFSEEDAVEELNYHQQVSDRLRKNGFFRFIFDLIKKL